MSKKYYKLSVKEYKKLRERGWRLYDLYQETETAHILFYEMLDKIEKKQISIEEK